ncbi:MAG: carbohydrate ABC transporter permease [Candidatus Hydrogenedentes bacterium]|nr:carbohydrate ABC transporter permease [Candidatus Hydrogenedentota bacterium]
MEAGTSTTKKQPRDGRQDPAWLRLTFHVVLMLIALMMMTPFAWMILTSLKPLSEVEMLNPIPTEWRFGNYMDVFTTENISFGKYYFNSILVAGWVTLLTCITSAMAAFAFARLEWRGRDTVFKLYLATMMVPIIVTMIPNYTILVSMKLLDSYLGLIIPVSFSAFGTFLLRQFMLTIPPSLDEAATIDGANSWQVFWELIMPLSRSGLIVLAIFTFIGNYGSFLWPLILIKTEHLRTLPVGMLYFDTVYAQQTNLIMAASVLNVLPMIILFVLMQRYLVSGIQLGGVKG